MALYRVLIPYESAAPGPQVRYTTLEIEAESEPVAKRFGVAEFEEMSVLSSSGERPRVVERDIRVERAPVARRSAFDVNVSNLGPEVASARLTGSLKSSNFHKLQEVLDDLKDQGVRRLVLDLSGLSYVNSTGLSLFVAASDMFDVRMAAVPVKISNILKMIGLDKLFPTFTGVGEAAKAPGGQKLPGS